MLMSDLWGELAAAQAAAVGAAPEFVPGNLEAKFVAPPFTVLDTRQGYWQDRRRSWLSLGIKSELGRGADLLSLSPAEGARERWQATTATRQAMERQNAPGYRAQAALRSGEGRELQPGKGNARTDYGAYTTNEEEGAQGGTSIFDPVLCELMYRWFAPEGGLVLDPFAGGSVRGIVAAKLGHPYTGIDLSAAQLAANRAQAAAILDPSEPVPSWLHGDSRHLEELLPAGQRYDMVLTCPPYFDLEVYSDDPADLSNAADYGHFLEGYFEVIARAAQRLLDERFMVLVVSEVRDQQGYCHGLVPDTIIAARRAGLHLYNEAVLVNAAGSLPLRVTKYMEASRKLGRAHQNVLVFVKGKPPRGWSWDRTPPPSPQLGLGLEPEPAPSPPPLAQPAPEAPAPAPEPTTEVPAAPGPSVAGELEPELAAVQAEVLANLEAHVPMPCSREHCTLEAGHAGGHHLEVRTSDGYLADPTTGEVLEAPTPPDDDPFESPAWEAMVETGTAYAAAMLGPERLEPLPGWDQATWATLPHPRPCYTCGRQATGQYRDGSAMYDHSHAPKEAQR
jgi:hypothetical protein